MRTLWVNAALVCGAGSAFASIFGTVQGVVHDPQHRPVQGARVVLKAAHSDYTVTVTTASDGSFRFTSIPLGDYSIEVKEPGFAVKTEALTLASETSAVLHFELAVAGSSEAVSVTSLEQASANTVTPTTLVDRQDIAETPGADRTNSLALITDFVPGAYVTHDQLHIRGGHQTDWQIDGVEIPNTNIGSNLAAQIDPKDIDYVEIQRGSYTADVGDRTYGVFNVVPRTGFERSREGEVVLNAGNFLQTNDQLNFGDHTQKFAYYASLNGNRSDSGLAPPVARTLHDATNGYGGFTSLIYNKTPKDQLRLIGLAREDYFQIPYDPSSTDFEAQQYDSSGLRDGQHETDVATAFSYIHTFNSSTVLQVSPFYHYNKVNYEGSPADQPVDTTYKRASTYAGGQASMETVLRGNTLQAGIYAFGQHDQELFGARFSDASNPDFSTPYAVNGGIVEEYLSDNLKATSWLTLIGGLRFAQFRGPVDENEVDPRVGVAVRVPRIGWVFRGFYGRFYQPPPLLTVACGSDCSAQNYALSTGSSFAPLHGERDEEHQFGLQIPYRGWSLDIDTFKTRANNFLDHSNIGESSIYLPVTIDGALIQAWELTLHTPRNWHYGNAHVAYSNQIAKQRGAVTGGLVCYDPTNSGICTVDNSYTPLDHDQRNTLNVGFDAHLPWHAYASTNVYYGSGFTNGAPDPATPYANNYLPAHTSVDVAIGKAFSERLSGSITSTNLGNVRVLLDNSLTFGGFHYDEPRQVFAELRYKFHF